MKVIVGLGNPGKAYAHTPHNVGFDVVHELARRLGCTLSLNRRFAARVGRTVGAETELLLVQPQTYMNDSGAAVAPILRYRKLTPADLVVVLDDADLPLGRLRIRKQGSSGGHRGLQSIVDALGTGEFIRVRVGIGRGESGGTRAGAAGGARAGGARSGGGAGRGSGAVRPGARGGPRYERF